MTIKVNGVNRIPFVSAPAVSLRVAEKTPSFIQDSIQLPPFQKTLNQVTAYVDSKEIFPAMEELLKTAKERIQMDYYILSGEEGWRIANILAQKIEEGVRVQLFYNFEMGTIPKISKSMNEILHFLHQKGVETFPFPIKHLPNASFPKPIDHNKLIVVDGQQAMVGGMNVADDFANNHDVMLKVVGPAARDLSLFFSYDWSFRPFPDAPPTSDQSLVQIVRTGIGQQNTREVVTQHVKNAKNRIWLEMFWLSDKRILEELIKRGKDKNLDIRILLDPGRNGDLVPVINWAPQGFPNLYPAYELQKAGIPARWYVLKQGQVHMHTKMSLFDNTLIVGSTNWTKRSFDNNGETSLEIEGGSAFKKLSEMFEKDWEERSAPIDLKWYQKGMAYIIKWGISPFI